jgi:hypothetical protein
MHDEFFPAMIFYFYKLTKVKYGNIDCLNYFSWAQKNGMQVSRSLQFHVYKARLLAGVFFHELSLN